MNKSALYQIFETIETFIRLRQQNLLIYSWIQLKNRNKRLSHLHQNGTQHISQEIINKKFQKIIGKDINSKEGEEEHIFTPRVDTGLKRLQTQNDKQIVALNERLNRKISGNYITYTGKSNKNKASRDILYPTQNQQVELQDSDQFQHLVLERLAKLQESIHKLMREKKGQQKDGKPLIKTYLGEKTVVIEKDELSDPSNQIITKQRFLEELRNKNEQPYNIIYNLRYIPVNRKQDEPTANIQRIKNLIQYNYQERFIDDIDQFNENNIRVEQQPNTHSRKVSTSLYMNRYRLPKNPKDKIHYRPVDIEMQTVIQPRKKYFRQGIVLKDQKKTLKKSFISNNSGEARRNNLSSFY